MNTISKTINTLLTVAFVTSCATPAPLMPKELFLKDPSNRQLDEAIGSTKEENATKCAYNMINMSPSRIGAKNLEYRIIGVSNPLVIEIDATLLNIGTFGEGREVTFRCEILNGKLSTKWTRGLN